MATASNGAVMPGPGPGGDIMSFFLFFRLYLDMRWVVCGNSITSLLLLLLFSEIVLSIILVEIVCRKNHFFIQYIYHNYFFVFTQDLWLFCVDCFLTRPDEHACRHVPCFEAIGFEAVGVQ